MDFELPEELAEVQKLARDFSEKEIAPTAAKDDREHLFRKDLVGKMGYRSSTAATALAFSPTR